MVTKSVAEQLEELADALTFWAKFDRQIRLLQAEYFRHLARLVCRLINEALD